MIDTFLGTCGIGEPLEGGGRGEVWLAQELSFGEETSLHEEWSHPEESWLSGRAAESGVCP